jgi:hypothetical protein
MKRKETKMNTQNDKAFKKSLMTIFCALLILLAGGWLLASIRYGADVIAPALMFLLALCLIVFAIWSEKNWLAIIPGGLCASIGVVVTLEMLIPDNDLSGQAMMFLFALSFIIFATRSKKNWWAIILGGIFASIGLVVMLEILIPQQEFPILQSTLHWGVYTWVMLLGFAATFGVTWLLRKGQPTAWTKYPAVGLLVIALMALILGSRFQEIWMESVLVAIGVMFVLGLLHRVHLPSRQQPPHLKA